jgi:hypothetical protein
LMIKKAQSSSKFARSQNALSKGQCATVTNERHCRASGLVLPPFATLYWVKNLKPLIPIADRSSSPLWPPTATPNPSATGQDGFIGRWRRYEANGHGQNVVLRRRGYRDYSVSILEVASPDMARDDIFARETFWKDKLGVRAQSLNAN